MKISIMFAAVTAMIIGVSSFSQVGVGQDKVDDKGWPKVEKAAVITEKESQMIELYVEMIEISAIEYAEMMTAPLNSDHTQMRMKLLQLVKEEKAKLVANESIMMRSGEKSTVESVRRSIHPTSYTEAGFSSSDNNKQTVIPPMPTAFEIKNLGFTLNVEPSLNKESKLIDLNLAPELETQTGEVVMAKWKTTMSESNVTMPTFYTLRVETAVSVKSGQFLRLNSFTPEKDGKPDFSRKVVLFVKASLLRDGE